MITGEDYGVITGKIRRVHRALASLRELSTFTELTLSFVKLTEVFWDSNISCFGKNPLWDVKTSIPRCRSPDSDEDRKEFGV